jgi:hypothetical protein
LISERALNNWITFTYNCGKNHKSIDWLKSQIDLWYKSLDKKKQQRTTNKDKIVEILSKYGLVSDLQDKQKEQLGLDDNAPLYNLYGKVATKILNSIQTLDRDKVIRMFYDAEFSLYRDEETGEYLCSISEKDLDILKEQICNLAVREVGNMDKEQLGNNAEPIRQYPEDNPGEER